MAQTNAIIEALKQTLRVQKVTYADVASKLELSEASVKRLFSDQQFSLKRLDQVCELLGIEISDLLRGLESVPQVNELDIAQEKKLVTDTKLLIAAVSCLNRWSFDEMLDTYQFEQPELIQKLVQLDKMGLIELLPNNRIKLLISPDFSWQKNGPIQRFFESQVQQDYFQCRFDKPGELRLFITGMLSSHSNDQIQQKIKRLAQEFRHLHQENLALPLEERHGMSMVLSIRPWELKVFEELRREDAHKPYPGQ